MAELAILNNKKNYYKINKLKFLTQLTAFIILLSHAIHDSNMFRAKVNCAIEVDCSTPSLHRFKPEG